MQRDALRALTAMLERGEELPSELARWLETAPAWSPALALANRNKLVRELHAQHFSNLNPTPAAQRIVALIARHRPMPPGAQPRPLDTLLEQIEGTGARWPLAERQLRTILCSKS